MLKRSQSKWICVLLVTLGTADGLYAEESIRSSLRFHASFDRSLDADFAKGDSKVYTATNLKRTEIQPGNKIAVVRRVPGGKWGSALHFADKSTEVLFYQANKNVPYSEENVDMTISFWLSVDPKNGLKPGYVDPFQITEKAWNDAAVWVDFSKDEMPRHFRLGVFPDRTAWNPNKAKWEDVPVSKRPRIDVTNSSAFSSDRWTHIGITIKGINSKQPCHSILYVDGKEQGKMDRDGSFTWNIDRVAIMLGIAYIGKMDDFAVFDRVLTSKEIKRVMTCEGGIAKLK